MRKTREKWIKIQIPLSKFFNQKQGKKFNDFILKMFGSPMDLVQEAICQDSALQSNFAVAAFSSLFFISYPR